MTPLRRTAYVVLGTLSFVYIAVTLAQPVSQATSQYGISEMAVRLLQLTIVGPVTAIWFLALYGSLGFKAYAASISDSRDGNALNYVANGLIILIATLVASTTLQAFMPWMRQDGLQAGWTVMANYVGAFGHLLAFASIYHGSNGLAKLVAYKSVQKGKLIGTLVLVPLVGLYAYTMFHNPARNSAPVGENVSSYFLSDPMLLLTIVLPFSITWFIGMLAIVNINAYYRHSEGIIYRKSLAYLTKGLIAVVASSLVIQMISAMGPALASWGLSQVILLLYILIVIYSAGHVLVLKGARRLARIEEAGAV